MINMAVVNLKDIIKYLVKTSMILLIILVITRYFLINNFNKINFNFNLDYKYIINKTLPIFEKTGIGEDINEKEEYNIFEKILSSELTMMNFVEEYEIAVADNKEIASDEENKNETIENLQDVKDISEIKTKVKTEVIETNVPNKYTDIIEGVEIKNETDHNLSKEIQDTDIELNLKNVLIYHTHTCESYTSSEKYKYKQTGNYRTTDKNFSVVRVGRELAKYLESNGFSIIHDETYHDYPSYTGSYYNSLDTIEKILKDNKNYDIVFDIHRDAIGDNTYAPTVKIGEEYAAQLMFVIGSDGGVDKHENWEQNLKFAIKVQKKADELYPGLFKPIILRNSDYNQFVAKGASIIEVGATGNTLDQCLVSMKYLSKVLSEL